MTILLRLLSDRVWKVNRGIGEVLRRRHKRDTNSLTTHRGGKEGKTRGGARCSSGGDVARDNVFMGLRPVGGNVDRNAGGEVTQEARCLM